MTAEPSRLELNLLGPVEALVDGHPLVVDTKKAVALLAYLSVDGEEHSRDHLADLLWPDADPDRARATLRRTLSALRSGLGNRWIAADRSSVRFIPDGDSRIDVDRLALAVGEVHGHGADEVCPRCVEMLKPMTVLVRGEFMQGFDLRGCSSFDDWMLSEAEHQRRRVSAVLERLSTALASQGRYAEAIDVTGRWLEFDPLLERAHRARMLFHAWSGDRSGAVDSYRDLVAVLERELGVEPLEETTELYEAILEEDLPRAPAPERRIRAVAPPVTSGYPFVGRSESLDRLRSLVAAGHGIAVVEGEIGVGKTRLLEELVGELEPSGVTVLLARAHRSETSVAYAPIQTVLSGVFERDGAPAALASSVIREVARLVPSLGEPAPVEPADTAARARFLDAICQAIAAAGERVVLCVDDLHWLDTASLELTGYLARRLQRLGVVLILTRRPEETPIGHPVSMLVDDLVGEADIVRLDRLDPAAVADLVSASGVGGIDSDAVFGRTKGLPFFVVEYLDAARAGRTELPAAVRRLVRSRLTDVDAVGRQLITAAAVVGPVIDVDTIRAVSGRSDDEVLAGLDELTRRAILKERDDGTLEFVHEQLRDVAYEDASRPRRRLLHRRAGEHLLTRSGSGSDLRSVAAAADHLQAAGNDAEAAELSVRAADLAVDVYAFDEAIVHLEGALALGVSSRGPLLRRIGDLRTLLGDYGAALGAYESARAALRESDGLRDIAAVAHSIGEVYRRLRRWDLAAASFEEALAGLGAEDALGSTISADWAFVEHRRGATDRAKDLISIALERAAISGDAGVLAHAHKLAGMLSEDPAVRIGHLERALEYAADASGRAAILNNLALSLFASGDTTGAVGHGRRALAEAAEAGDRHRTAALHDNLADYLHAAGEEEAAMEELKQAVALFSEVGLEPGELAPEVWLLKEW